MFNSKIKLLLLIIISLLFLFNQTVLAEDTKPETKPEIEKKCDYQLLRTEGSNIKIYNVTCLSPKGEIVKKIDECRVGWLISNPCCACCGDCTLNDTLALAANIARQILKYLGVLALVLFIIGGIIWMTSGGNTQQIEKGKKMITGAVIGLIIVIGAYLFIQTLIKVLVPQDIQKEYFKEFLQLK